MTELLTVDGGIVNKVQLLRHLIDTRSTATNDDTITCNCVQSN